MNKIDDHVEFNTQPEILNNGQNQQQVLDEEIQLQNIPRKSQENQPKRKIKFEISGRRLQPLDSSQYQAPTQDFAQQKKVSMSEIGPNRRRKRTSLFEINQEVEQDPEEFKKQQRFKQICFVMLLILKILLNIDQGVFPNAIQAIKKDLNCDSQTIGLFGSAEYFGLIVGSIFASFIFEKVQVKRIIVFSCLMMLFAVSLWIYITNVDALIFSRVMTGFFNVFFCIFFPVWVDLHGLEKKTLWLTLLQVTIPLGVFLGYIITAVLQTYFKWNTTFYIQIVLALPFIFFVWYQDEGTMTLTDIQIKTRLSRYSSVYQRNTLSNIDHIELLRKLQDQNLEYESIKNIKTVLTNVKFVCCCLTICAMYFTGLIKIFIVTGIQYWMTDYIMVYMGIERGLANFVYSIVSITAPIGGVIIGGIVTQKQGGYDAPIMNLICFGISMITIVFAIILPFVTNFGVFIAFIWIVLFSGGALMPPLAGMMICTIPQNLKQYASAVSQFLINSLGFTPSPLLFGIVVDQTHSYQNGMILLMFWTINVFVLLGVNYFYYKYTENKKLKEQL